MCVAIAAAALAAPAIASAQSNAYEAHAQERHVYGRVQGGVGLRLTDYYSQGALQGGFVQGMVGYSFRSLGPMRFGAHFGAQYGYDPAYALSQGGVSLGLSGHFRFLPILGLLVRLDGSMVVTRGSGIVANQAAHNGLPDGSFALARYNSSTPRDASGQAALRYVSQYTIGVAPGFELGIAPAIYLTSGIALTAEVSLTMYGGDGSAYLGVGAGAGLLIDYELLP